MANLYSVRAANCRDIVCTSGGARVAEPEFEFRGGKIKNIKLEAKFIKDFSSSNTTLLIVNYELYQIIVYK